MTTAEKIRQQVGDLVWRRQLALVRMREATAKGDLPLGERWRAEAQRLAVRVQRLEAQLKQVTP